jgi:arylsulfatase A
MGLYNIAEDVGEYSNLLKQHPEVAPRLMDRLKHDIDQGRSTPGAPQENDGNVPLRGVWKDK